MAPTEPSMMPFQSAFLGKRIAEKNIKNDGARRLERRLRRHRQSRSRAAAGATSCRVRLDKGELNDSPALRTCSHSQVNAGYAQDGTAAHALDPRAVVQPNKAETTAPARGGNEEPLSDQDDTDRIDQLAMPRISNARAEPCAHSVEPPDTLASFGDSDVRASGAVTRWTPSRNRGKLNSKTDQLARRGQQLCARMNALAATLNSQPLEYMASRSRSVPPLGCSNLNARESDGSNATALTRASAAMSLAPSQKLPRQRVRLLPDGGVRDRRARRATVPVTRDGSAERVCGTSGCRHGQLAPLETKDAVRCGSLQAQSPSSNSEPAAAVVGSNRSSTPSAVEIDVTARSGSRHGFAPPLPERRR